MIEPTLRREMQLFRSGVRLLAGVDEAGRGPLAGPVVAAAIGCRRIPPSDQRAFVVRDVKLMTLRQRERSFAVLAESREWIYAVGIVESDVIDDIGIFRAAKRAMKEAVEGLEEAPDIVLADGGFMIDGLAIPQESAPKADQNVWVCAAASIIAKGTRDQLMRAYHEQYPQYGFDRHKGYGTAAHQEAIRRYGLCPIHRRSFLTRIAATDAADGH